MHETIYVKDFGRLKTFTSCKLFVQGFCEEFEGPLRVSFRVALDEDFDVKSNVAKKFDEAENICTGRAVAPDDEVPEEGEVDGL